MRHSRTWSTNPSYLFKIDGDWRRRVAAKVCDISSQHFGGYFATEVSPKRHLANLKKYLTLGTTRSLYIKTSFIRWSSPHLISMRVSFREDDDVHLSAHVQATPRTERGGRSAGCLSTVMVPLCTCLPRCVHTQRPRQSAL